jgi:hypothetical protein
MKENLWWKSKSKSIWKDNPDLYDRAIFRIHSQATVFDAIIRSKNPRMPPREAIMKAVRYMEENSFWRSNPASLIQNDELKAMDPWSERNNVMEYETTVNDMSSNMNMSNELVGKVNKIEEILELQDPIKNEASPQPLSTPPSAISDSLASEPLCCSDGSSRQETNSYSASLESGAPTSTTVLTEDIISTRKSKKKRRKGQKLTTISKSECETSASTSVEKSPTAVSMTRLNRVRVKRLLKKKRKRLERQAIVCSHEDTFSDIEDKPISEEPKQNETNVKTSLDWKESSLSDSDTLETDAHLSSILDEREQLEKYLAVNLSADDEPILDFKLEDLSELNRPHLLDELNSFHDVAFILHDDPQSFPQIHSSALMANTCGGNTICHPNKSYAEAVRISKDNCASVRESSSSSMINNSCHSKVTKRALIKPNICTWAEMCRLGKSAAFNKNNHNFI